MRILGVDPGTVRCGWCVIKEDVWQASGVIKMRAAADLGERLQILYAGLCLIFKTWEPDHVALERAFIGKYATAALALGEARGLVQGVCFSFGVQCTSYSPKEVKKSVWRGDATKAKVGAAIKILLNVPRELEEDEADACAVALCHWGQVRANMILAKGKSYLYP